MKKKILTVSLFVFLALPIPVAILGCLFTGLWFLKALLTETSIIEIICAIVGILIGATYTINYIIAAHKTRKEKKLSFGSFLPLLHCVVAIMYLISLKPVARYINYTTEHFGFAKKDFVVVEELDTHEGFIGDGSYYLILDCSDNKEKALEKIKEWKKLPLSENLDIVMYGGKRNGVTQINGLNEEAHIPKIENGYYIFEDRASDSADDSMLFDRHSYNFSIAIYDCDTDRLYYFVYDT